MKHLFFFAIAFALPSVAFAMKCDSGFICQSKEVTSRDIKEISARLTHIENEDYLLESCSSKKHFNRSPAVIEQFGRKLHELQAKE